MQFVGIIRFLEKKNVMQVKREMIVALQDVA